LNHVATEVAPLPTGTATFLFTDIQGSTQLVQKLGIERWRDLLDTHYSLLRREFADHQGREVNTEGDAFFIAFAQAREAVAACVAGQLALAAHPWPEDAVIQVRMGLHTGEAAMVGGDYMGIDIHRAARIASSAHGGQVVMSDVTRALVADVLPDGVSLVDLGDHRLKDLARPERLWQLRIEGLRSEFPALKSLDLIRNNLPTQLTSFVGREAELAQGLKLLESSRLLTLTGPGGTGKTRLSLQIAAEVSDQFKDGVFFVPLAPVSDPALVPATILQALGVQDAGTRSPQEVLVEYLAGRNLLLVLDNFEQLLPAAPLVGELLKAAPAVKALTSSRAALRVYGEQEFPVPPLGVPRPTDTLTLEALSQFEAVQLFIERAVAVKPDFTVTNENAPAVAGLTALVDGLPLAVELAAARIRLLTPQAMLSRLEKHIGDLAGGARDLPERQQTLKGAIAWSYDLLDPGTRTLFARFAVFVRGASLEQLEVVCGPTEELGVDVLDGLETLVDQNLVRSLQDLAEPRFFMLHVIREFALERLAAAPDADDVHRRHAESFLALAESAAPELTGTAQKTWLDQLDLEEDNLRAALTHFIETGNAPLASRMLTACWRFWQMRGHLSEGRQRAEAVLAMPGLADPYRYAALEATGGIAYWQGTQDAALDLYLEALDVARGLGDRATLANALYNAAFPDTITARDVNRAEALFDEALTLFRELEDEAGVAKTLWGMADVYYLRKPPDFEKAIELLHEALPVMRRRGDNFGLGWALYMLGSCLIGVDRFEGAMQTLADGLRLFAAADDRSGISLSIYSIGLLAIVQGDAARAAMLEGARLTMEASSGVGLLGSRMMVFLEHETALKQLPETEPEAYRTGLAMTTAQAIALALEGS
jgi:predicted ATPase/class 3 adenylate cyclase